MRLRHPPIYFPCHTSARCPTSAFIFCEMIMGVFRTASIRLARVMDSGAVTKNVSSREAVSREFFREGCESATFGCLVLDHKRTSGK
jgi:hypothetical protein